MTRSLMLVITSLLSILLLSLHFTDDIVRGISSAGIEDAGGIAILTVYLCGAVLLRDRLPGLIITLLGSIFTAGMPVIHMMGKGFPDTVRSSGGFFFFWAVFVLGVTGTFGIILSVLELWRLRPNRSG